MTTTRKTLLGVCFAAPVADRSAAQSCTGIGGYDADPGAPTFATQYPIDAVRRNKAAYSKATLHADNWTFDLQLRP